MEKIETQRKTEIQQLQEWQDNQYQPGYYVGGKINPAFLRRSKAAGYGMLCVGAVTLLALCIIIPLSILYDPQYRFSPIDIMMIFIFVIPLLFILAGVKILRRR